SLRAAPRQPGGGAAPAPAARAACGAAPGGAQAAAHRDGRPGVVGHRRAPRRHRQVRSQEGGVVLHLRAVPHPRRAPGPPAIARLPEREKLVITLYYHEELTMKEVGAVLGLTESRVSQLHSQAMLRLKPPLSDHFGDPRHAEKR